MLFPKKVKHRKWHVLRVKPEKAGKATRGTEVNFGSHGLKATAFARVKSNQIEAARKAGNRYLGKNGRMWIRIFPDMPITNKPSEVKRGKGKGDPAYYVAQVKPGRVIFEVDGVSDEIAREALRKAGTKLPMTTKVVTRE